MKCFDVTRCSDEQRASCFVWNSLRDNPDEMERIKCWVLKGVYQKENREQLERCHSCSYYLLMHEESAIVSDFDTDVAVITLEGVLNNDRTRALEKVWGAVLESGKTMILLRMEKVNNVYSCGLGMLVKIHKEARAASGMLVLCGLHGYVMTLLESTRLNRILNIAPDAGAARGLFDEERRRCDAAAQDRADEDEPSRVRPHCFEYWNNHNPRNATSCDDCFRKIKPTDDPCWIVEGIIEGVSFQYVNEECESCPYFQEFGQGKGSLPPSAAPPRE